MPLYKNFPNTSLKLKNKISDETGSAALVFADSPVFSTNITTPLIYGGTAVGSFVDHISTTGAGTTTGLAWRLNGGTNGATNIVNIYNDAQFLINTSTRNPGSLGTFRVAQGTSLFDTGQLSAGIGAVWLNAATPSTTNFSIATETGGNTRVNSVSNVLFQISGTSRLSILSATQNLTSSYQIISANGIKGGTNDGVLLPIGYTASVSLGAGFATTGRNVVFDGVTFNDAAATPGPIVIASNPHVYIKRPTYSATTSGRTITTAATLQIQNAPTTTGGNVAITNPVAIWVEAGATRLDGDLVSGNKVINTTAGDSATINSINGRFRKDTSGATFTLTNSFITANSILILDQANAAFDATATSWTKNCGAGSATITFNAAPTADFDMDFFVIN